MIERPFPNVQTPEYRCNILAMRAKKLKLFDPMFTQSQLAHYRNAKYCSAVII